mgnify:CR=1 FL=1
MMTNKKITLFLILTFGFLVLSINSSRADYNDTEKSCFTVQTGGDLTVGGLLAKDMCYIRGSAKLSFQRACSIRGSGGGGAELNWIKVPYGQGGENAQNIKKIIQSTNSIDWSNFGNLSQDYGCGRFNECSYGDATPRICTIPTLTECIGESGANPCTTNCLMGAQIYINVKTAMIRSCLPGSLTATRWGNIGCWLPGWGGGDVGPKNNFLNVGNYSDSSISGCGINDPGAMSISTNISPISGKRKVSVGDEFKINWTLSNPGANCTLLGKDATTLENFSQDIKASAVLVNGSTGAITPAKGDYIFPNAKEGIYTYTLSCDGVLNGKNSPERGTVSTDPITIYVGDIPPPPQVTLKTEPIEIKKGESATLSWISENAASVSINQGIGVVQSRGSRKVSPQFTTRYTINAAGKFPELGLASQSVTLKVVSAEIQRATTSYEVPQEKPAEEPKPVEKPKVDLKINGQKELLTMNAPATFNISWNLDKYCLTYGSWLGIKNKAGEERQTQTKPGTYTYNMYCPTIGTDSVTVKVVGVGVGGPAAIPMPVAEASISTDEKNFSNKIRVIRGKPTDIWLSAGYDVTGDRRASHDETGKWTKLMSESGQCQWNYDLNQGVPTFEAVTNEPETAKDCALSLGRLTFYDKPGVYRYGALRLVQNDGKVSNVGYVSIVVQEPPPPKTPPIIDLRINNLEGPSVALGAPAEYIVSWNAANADTCIASDSWDGNKFLAGSERFISSEKKEFIYTLSCIGKLGTTTKRINLKVAELPVCDFSAEPTVLNKKSVFDQQSVLTWKCKFANSCLISPDVGIKVETFGSARVSPKITTGYNLICGNLEGNASFVQTVEVR